ncbi:RNA-directed DNA polymerase [Tanacetum coccineum]|uniref:RNA-directed DNA polymerase n=1 Tax=Tanacetum coccineum TaxID=301880 RepID=A0ABQ5J556_9ASTR
MTRSTIKNPIKPFEEPKREMHKKRRVARLQQRNESLSIAGHNLFDEGPSFFPNQILRPRAFESIPPLTHPGLCTENPFYHIKYFLSIVDHIQADGATRDASRLRFFHFTLKGKAKEWLDKIPLGTITSWEQIVSKFLDKFFLPERITRIRDKILRFCQSDNESIKDACSLNEDEGWDRIEELIQYQDDTWDEPFVSKLTLNDRLNMAHQQLSFLTSSTPGKTLKNSYLICDICGEAHVDNKCDQVKSREQACLSGGDIYDDHSLLKFYQNDDIPQWGNLIRKKEEEEGPDWVVRGKFEDEMANFMMEKKCHLNGFGEMLHQQRKDMHKKFSQILSKLDDKTINKEPTLAITTRSGTTMRDPSCPNQPNFAPIVTNETTDEEGVLTKKENPETPLPSTLSTILLNHPTFLFHLD